MKFNTNIKDIEFKIISYVATGYSTYTLGALFNPHSYGTISGLIWGASGVLISALYAKKVTSPLVESGSKKGLIIASLPFVLTWFLVAPTAHETYMNVFVKEGYSELKQEQTQLKDAKKNADDIKISIKENALSIKKADRTPLNNLINNRQSNIDNLKIDVAKERIIWKESTQKASTIYESYKSDFKRIYGRSYGNGAVAINDFATMLYEKKVNSLKIKYDNMDANFKASGTDKSKIIKLEEAQNGIARLKKVTTDIENIEKADTLGLKGIYLIMILWGIFFELFLTHVSFWLNPVMKKEKRRDLMLNDLATNPKLFLSLFDGEVNHKINAVFSVLRCYAHGDKLTEKNINAHSFFTNKNTNRKYKPNRVGMKAKRVLTEYGFLDTDNPNIDQNELLDVIEEIVT